MLIFVTAMLVHLLQFFIALAYHELSSSRAQKQAI
ncbi:hypothetical protein CY35_12G086200 [Sphagnum magellanicum]|nr:hypothetical protein CY35_12G086200 [Sphagnum magellanicum]